jgi:hypothetical protein
MIRFKCGGCGKMLGMPESEAGKLAACPVCKAKTRIPAPGATPGPASPLAPTPRTAPPVPAAQTAPKPPPHEEIIDLEAVEEEADRPTKKRAKTARRQVQDDEDHDEEVWDDEEKQGLTANRIRGIVGIVLGLALVGFVVLGGLSNTQLGDAGPIIGYVLAGLLVVAGIYYLITG